MIPLPAAAAVQSGRIMCRKRGKLSVSGISGKILMTKYGKCLL
jgi:hypothetical protein